jgi:hypothetical protein
MAALPMASQREPPSGRRSAGAVSEHLSLGKGVAARTIRSPYAAGQFANDIKAGDRAFGPGPRHSHAAIHALEGDPDFEEVIAEVETVLPHPSRRIGDGRRDPLRRDMGEGEVHAAAGRAAAFVDLARDSDIEETRDVRRRERKYLLLVDLFQSDPRRQIAR